MRNIAYILGIFSSLLISCTCATVENDKNTCAKFAEIEQPAETKTAPQALNDGDFDFSKIKGHPRIFFKDSEIDFIKNSIKTNNVANRYHNQIIKSAKEHLNAPKLEYKLDASGRRILGISREFLRRIALHAYAYKFTKDPIFLAAAEREMLNSASFKDFNDRHFLDTAEMALALSIGYDALYNELKPETRQAVETALIEKALKRAIVRKYVYKLRDNWNQVCSAAMITTAICVFEKDEALTKEILRKCSNAPMLTLNNYAPDGVYPEGLAYWDFGTSFQVLHIKALERVFGKDFGLSKAQGFLESAEYETLGMSHTGKIFNFSDATENCQISSAIFWFANRSNNLGVLSPIKEAVKDPKSVGEHGITVKTSFARLLPLFMDDIAAVDFDKIPEKSTPFKIGLGPCSIALIRGSINGQPVFMGIKAGIDANNHGHADTGSFVLDIGENRFVSDIAILPYQMMEKNKINLWDKKQDSERWRLIRYTNSSHSTLTVNGKVHNVYAKAPIVGKIDNAACRGVLIDLTAPLAPEVEKATRAIKLIDNKKIEIVDTIKAPEQKDAEVVFCIPTQAEVKMEKDSIFLKRDNKTLKISATSNANTKPEMFDRKPTNPKDYFLDNYFLTGFKSTVKKGQTAVIKTEITLLN